MVTSILIILHLRSDSTAICPLCSETHYPTLTPLLPLSGLAQCAELCWQLRGQAGRRQVAGAKVALQHNIGLGGAVVVALYRMGFPQGGRSGAFYII